MNPYKLYTGAGISTKLRIEATAAITQGIKKGKINLRNLWDNPILEKYRSVGADDTVVRDIIHDILTKKKKAK